MKVGIEPGGCELNANRPLLQLVEVDHVGVVDMEQELEGGAVPIYSHLGRLGELDGEADLHVR